MSLKSLLFPVINPQTDAIHDMSIPFHYNITIGISSECVTNWSILTSWKWGDRGGWKESLSRVKILSEN